MDDKPPKWYLELDRFKAFKTVFIIEGNIYDIHSYPTATDNGIHWDLLKLDNCLHNYLGANGYGCVVFYDHVDGFSNDFNPQFLNTFLNLAGGSGGSANLKNNRFPATLDRATQMIRTAMDNRQTPVGIIMNMASRYVASPDNLTEEERQFYSRLMLATLKPRQVRAPGTDRLMNNLLLIVANKVNDIPAWFYLDNPYVKNISIGKPDRQTRQRFIDSQLRFFVDSDKFSPDELAKYKEQFVELTDGMKNLELNGLRVLCQQESIPINRIRDAISLYKYGLKENPWDEISGQKLAKAQEFILNRVKGQPAAVTQTLDIIKRAVSGMSGLQHSLSSSKPKGILFFAGPTGTGKTEMAKTLASLLFGDDNACVRFDMSEYQVAHADQKLLGAPPGYVGYEAGGQLTNAVKEKPFSILLFDEIEKAHGSILDKFLQILEDGRMTDGQGETVYFSESIIIFTSNLGIVVKDKLGNRMANVNPEMPYDQIKERVLQAIKDYFVMELGRPEILNRIGNNFVVFDYIREDVAREILQSQLAKIAKGMEENKQLRVAVSESAFQFLLTKCLANLENGGRGIGNIVEKYFINPLSRFLFDTGITQDRSLTVQEIREEEAVVSVQCMVEDSQPLGSVPEI
ncbi:MAG: ATP-dependent Clp protease ATP-binding subunit [Syntrophomonadaceae bacterium]|nr:ATP-dependent Clp protease ATP-binding subunit [Syntrophomonadaceae bacterium]